MFTVQSVMLVLLGFLLATLLGFIVAPAYWARAVRLTTERLRRSLPISESEIRADKDRLRAQHAITVHQLQTRVDKAHMSAARQKVEINRREATIGSLERDLTRLNSNLEASENARHVLEQTIMDRVPKVEERLSEARQMLFQRDREMAKLQADTSKTYRALDEAMQINAQQRAEIDRLKSSIATRGPRSSARGGSVGETDMALRSELEALRTRTRDQASLISKLQELVAVNGEVRSGGGLEDESKSAALADVDSGLKGAQDIMKSMAEHDSSAVSEQADKLRELNATIEAQQTEIEKLQAALSVFQDPDAEANTRTLRDSRIALKARVASLEKETAGQAEVIKRLRSELASANDRSARQAAHYMNEMRRLGAGTVQTSVGVAEQGGGNGAAGAKRRPSLANRITETIPAVSADLARTAPLAVTGLSSKNGSAGVEAVMDPQASDDTGHNIEPTDVTDRDLAPVQREQPPPLEKPSDEETKGGSAQRRGGLMQRIAGIGKT